MRLSAVIMSNYYDLPFNDILDWKKFSVILKETDVYMLKDILRNISEQHLMTLNQNLVKVTVKILNSSFSNCKCYMSILVVTCEDRNDVTYLNMRSWKFGIYSLFSHIILHNSF